MTNLKQHKSRHLLPAIYLLPAAAALAIMVRDFFNLRSFTNLLNADTVFIIRVSLIQAFLSAAACFLFSIAPVLFIKNNKSSNLLSSFIRSTFFVPYYYPVVSTVISFSIVFTSFLPGIQYTLFSIILAHIFYNTPVMIKYISEGLVRIETEIHENAVLETSSWLRIFRFISLPIIIKSVSRAFFIVFSFCFTSFGVILALGNIKYSNLEISIFTSLNTALDFSSALGYGFLQFLILIIINSVISGHKSQELTSAHYPSKNSWRPWETFFSLTYITYEFVIIFLPVCYFILFSIKNNADYLEILFSENFNKHYPVLKALGNTFLVSSITSAFVTALTYIVLKKHSKTSEIIITSTLGISPAILSTAFLYISVIFGIHPAIMMIIGFFVISMPYSYSLMHQHITGFSRTILEAASLETKSRTRRFIFIELPVMYPVLIMNFLNIFAICFGEFTFAYVFNTGNEFPLLSTVNYSISSRRLIGETYALNSFSILFMMSVFGTIFAIRNRLEKRKTAHST